jgi:hypothetical protein
MTARFVIALALTACAARPPAPDACDFAIAKVEKDCYLMIHKADEASKPALRSECKERIDALPECK